MEGVAIGYNFERGPSMDHFSKVWSKLAQWFVSRTLKCEKLTTDDGRNLMRKAHMAFGQVS
jgi:hypothetical protein